MASGSFAVVPALWRLEMANGFATAERRGDLTASHGDRCLDELEGLMVSVIESSTLEASLRQSLSVARTLRLSAYDAVYLETARREHLPIATLDRALGQAATKSGIPLFT
ncbi:MAG: type II toxin-antitoxin system VapC family toxin [Candidatus Sulfotelmatobacter sp.]